MLFRISQHTMLLNVFDVLLVRKDIGMSDFQYLRLSIWKRIVKYYSKVGIMVK